MSIFDAIQDQVTPDRLLAANGSGKVRCVSPGHQDNNPSMRLYEDHVHCFSCGFHGDVIDVWAATRAIVRPIDAALDLAREFNLSLPGFSEEARQKAEERREQQADHKRLAQVCHAALEKHLRVREWWKRRGFGEELQKRFLLGANRDGTEAVIPFWHRREIRGLIRRKLEGEPKYRYPKAEDFVDGYRPLFIPGPTKGEVFLVEGIVDALAVAATGRAAVAVGATSISDAQTGELRKVVPEDDRIYVLPDKDESGAQAAHAWARRLFPKAAICQAAYGEGAKDIADLFAVATMDETGKHLGRLASGAQDMIDIETAVAVGMEEESVRERLSYVTEKIVPLLARISPPSARAATADIVAGQVKGLKVSWLNKAIAEEDERRERAAMVKAIAEEAETKRRAAEEHRQRVEGAQDEIDALFAPGVLGRLRTDAAEMHNVKGEEDALGLSLLVTLGAQLAPLPNGRPLGASMMITGDAGRGKNHIADAAVKPLPEEFYLTFEIASGQSLYYAAAENPAFLKHKFVYPNEIEGVEALIEFLRPMLSKGWARKFVTNKDSQGRSVIQEIIVEGPVTTAIPTVRNKTDDQLQSRLLVAELVDYPGRVKAHSAAVSELLHPDYAVADHSHRLFLWREGLRQLTEVRRVVSRVKHPDFALDDDQVSHGARLWANLMGLMSTHAWLEQRNREISALASGERAIVASPDDYEAAYSIFTEVCQRTIVNLSENHRKILGALYGLRQEFPNREGFPQREIAKAARVSLGTISNNKTFLATSVKLVKETEHGLALVEGAEPSWWEGGDKIMTGLPTPEQVRAWWEGHDPPPGGAEHAKHAEQAAEAGGKAHTYTRNGVQGDTEHPMNTFSSPEDDPEHPTRTGEHDQLPFTEAMNTENGTGKPKTGDAEEVFSVFRGSGDDPHNDEDPGMEF